jgi:hypothetical protein
MQMLARAAAVTLMAAGLLSSADAQKLRIESPQNGATVAPVAGMSNAVIIRFRTDDFKLVRVNENGGGNQVATSTTTTTTTTSDTNPMDASASRPDVGAAPAPTGSSKQEDMSTQPTSNLPQSDQPATATTTTATSRADRGQIRVTVDNSNWQFLHSSKDPITIVGLSPGQHTVKLELVGPNGMTVGSTETVNFNVGGSR